MKCSRRNKEGPKTLEELANLKEHVKEVRLDEKFR